MADWQDQVEAIVDARVSLAMPHKVYEALITHESPVEKSLRFLVEKRVDAAMRDLVQPIAMHLHKETEDVRTQAATSANELRACVDKLNGMFEILAFAHCEAIKRIQLLEAEVNEHEQRLLEHALGNITREL